MDKKEILAALGGIPEEVYDAIVASFYAETKGRLKELESFIALSDWVSVAKVAHAIKGSSANLRLTQIAETGKALEYAAKANDAVSVSKFYSVLLTQIP